MKIYDKCLITNYNANKNENTVIKVKSLSNKNKFNEFKININKIPKKLIPNYIIGNTINDGINIVNEAKVKIVEEIIHNIRLYNLKFNSSLNRWIYTPTIWYKELEKSIEYNKSTAFKYLKELNKSNFNYNNTNKLKYFLTAIKIVNQDYYDFAFIIKANKNMHIKTKEKQKYETYFTPDGRAVRKPIKTKKVNKNKTKNNKNNRNNDLKLFYYTDLKNNKIIKDYI